MYQQTHTTNSITYWIFIPILFIMGTLFLILNYLPIVGIFCLVIGGYGIYRFFYPKTWWCKISETSFEWGINKKTLGIYPKSEISSLEVFEERVVLILNDNSHRTIRQAETFFGYGLDKFKSALDRYGYAYK